MICHIHDKLLLWSSWRASGRRVRGLGYPSSSAFVRLVRSSHHAPHAPDIDEEACEIDAAVCALEGSLREVVMQFYLRAGTSDTHARTLGICRVTLYARLHQAQVRIMEYLQVGDDAISA